MKQLITSKTAEITAPVRMAIGFTKQLTLERKSSKDIFGAPFLQVAAKALAQLMEEEELKSKGVLYTDNAARPAKGAFVLLSEEAVAQMIEVLKDLGLTKFEDTTPVDFFIRPTVNVTQDCILPTPIASELVFQNSPDLVKLLFRVIVMDPMCIDEQGNNLYLKELPDNYVQSILNVLNPMAIYRTCPLHNPVNFLKTPVPPNPPTSLHRFQ